MRPAGPAPRSHAQRNAEARQRLMSALLELIAEKGFERTTASEIGERAGYSRNVVHDRFGSKHDLLVALSEQEFNDRLLPADRGTRAGTGLERVLQQIDDLIGAVRTGPNELRAIMVLAFEAPGPIAGLRQWWAEMMARYEHAHAELLRTGQQDGSVRAELDVTREAEIFVSYGTGLSYRWSLRPDAFDFEAELLDWRRRLCDHYAAPP